MNKKNSVNRLHGIAQFVLFITSYVPLFFLICLKQIYENNNFLNWGGFNCEAFILYIQKFALSSLLIIISIAGIWGCKILFKNLEKDSKNGDNVMITNINNKNSESIGYIATYIVPFLFQSFNSWYEIIAILFLMIIIYRIYINSNLLLINPLLSFRYSIFEIEFEKQNKKTSNGLIIIKDKFLDNESIIKIYPIGYKLYFATQKNTK